MATVGGNDIVFFGVVLEESGHVGAGSLFEGAENSDFILAPLGLQVSSERLVDVALEVNANMGANTVL